MNWSGNIMSLWTSIRDNTLSLLAIFGISKVVNPKTSWVDTREQIKIGAAQEVLNEASKNQK
jgi:hypothetical protein